MLMKILMRIIPAPVRRLIWATCKMMAHNINFVEIHLFAKITADLAKKEILFKAPAFTKDLVNAIDLIAPQYILRADNKSRLFWETEQNASCWAEDYVLSIYLPRITKPKKILEIGPGMGRSVVFLTKKYHWDETEFHLYESTGSKTKYTMHGPKFDDSFCGTISALEEILGYNNIRNYRLFDAKNLNFRLDNLPGPYDVIYSFYAIGFHWGLEHFFSEILSLMDEKTLGFFIVYDDFVPFEGLNKVNYKVVDYVAARPADKISKMLVISKNPL